MINGVGDQLGTLYVASGTINDGQQGREMGGSVVTATFGDGLFTCTFGASGLCSNPGNFSFAVIPDTSQTHSADWQITNLRVGQSAANTLLSIEMNGLSGNTVFNPRINSASHPVFNGNGNCAPNPAVATPGFGVCSDVSDGQGKASTTSAEASVLYLNGVRYIGNNFNGDLWATIRLTFNTAPFHAGEVFEFKADTDGVGALLAEVPEPGSAALISVGLLFLGLRKKIGIS